MSNKKGITNKTSKQNEQTIVNNPEPIEQIAQNSAEGQSPAAGRSQSEVQIQYINVDPRLIDPSPFQHRIVFHAAGLAELRMDFEHNGIHTPLTVRRNSKDEARYELVVGERRLRCALEMALPMVPILLRQLSDRQVREIQLSENIQRLKPNPLEEATAFDGLFEYHQDLDSLARHFGKSKSYVLARLQLLSLTPDIREMVLAGIFYLKDALEIACLATEAQQTFFGTHCKTWKENPGFAIPELRSILKQYRYRLDDARFEPSDDQLLPEAGSCCRCRYNSAVQHSLFPELDKTARCNKTACFDAKTRIHLRRTVEILIREEKAVAFLLPWEIDPMLEEVLADIPETKDWPRYRQSDVYCVYPPDKPDREDYFDTEEKNTSDNEGDVSDEEEGSADGDDNASSEEEYAEALKEYEEELREYKNRLQCGNYIIGLLLDKDGVKCLAFQRESKASVQNQMTVTAAAVKAALKDGTATPQLLEGGICRIIERETRSKELDAEKIQVRIHERFRDRLTQIGTETPLTSEDVVGLRLIVYQSLGWDGQEAMQKLLPFDPDDESNEGMKLYDWLAQLSEEQFAYMVRLTISRRPGAAEPMSETADILSRMASSIGVDIAAISAEQAGVAKLRNQRKDAVIFDLQQKIEDLNKTA
jgi:ParB/RepB/Spo0J family partition protein